jgi:outer membrane protein assembly factor BamB
MAQVKPATPALILVVVVVGLAAAPAGASSTAAIWTERFSGPGNFDNAASVAVSPDGSKVFVTGSSVGPTGNSDYVTIAYDAATGTNAWFQRYNGPGNGHDFASSVAVTPDGTKVIVTGWSWGSTGNYDYATIAYDAGTGANKWFQRYNGPGNGHDLAFSVVVSPITLKVIVTGGSVGPGSDSDYATIAYDAATGTNAWFKRYNGPGNGFDGAYDAAVSDDGSKVFVTGESLGSGSGRDFVTIGYDTVMGGSAWFQRFTSPGSSDEVGSSVAVSPNGSKVFVTGGGTGPSGNSDYITIAYDAAMGTKTWMRDYNGPGNSIDFANSIAVSPDNTKVFVTGGSVGSGTSSDYATIAYDAATGANAWFKNYNGPGNGNDVAYAVAVSPNGSKVVVTGGSLGSAGNWDYATIAYDASTGANAWFERYDGPGNRVDYASSVVVSPDSTKVFVTGSSDGAAGTPDYATIAYQA